MNVGTPITEKPNSILGSKTPVLCFNVFGVKPPVALQRNQSPLISLVAHDMWCGPHIHLHNALTSFAMRQCLVSCGPSRIWYRNNSHVFLKLLKDSLACGPLHSRTPKQCLTPCECIHMSSDAGVAIMDNYLAKSHKPGSNMHLVNESPISYTGKNWTTD